MAKERFLTVMIPIKDSDCEATVYPDLSALASAVPASAANVNKIYKLAKDGYARAWLNPATGVYEYHIVVDREFPYLGNPLEIYDFTYDATRMGTAPTISAQGVMRYALIENGVDVTLDGLWNQQCHVVFNGKKLYLKQIPTSGKSNEDARYRYDLDFVDASVVLESVYLYDVVSPFITDKPLSESASFSFYGDINELAKRINASLIRSGLASLTRKYVDYDDPYYAPLLPTMTVPYLTYEQWTLVNTNPHSLVPSVFSNDYGWQVFRYEIYIPLQGDYNRYLMDYIYENENGVYALTGYQCKIGKDKYGETTTSEEKLITFENNTIHEALQQFHDTFGLEYYITSEKDGSGEYTGNTWIMVADCEHDFADWDEEAQDFVRDDEGIPTSSQPFDYGSTKALLSKEKTNTTDKIVTRITGVGSSENIPWYYPNPSPDGWIRPFFTEHGVEQPNVTIDYPINEGTTPVEYTWYERFLKNRIGVPIKRGVVKNVLFGTDYNMALPAPSEDYNILVFYYPISTQGVNSPSITLELDYDPSQSKCSKIAAALLRDGETVGVYDSSETYADPSFFQQMLEARDGSSQQPLVTNKDYTLQIAYYIPKSEMPYSQHFDYEGYHYPSRALPVGETGGYGYVGENFYQAQGLLPFIDWAILGQTLPHVYDTGYSVDGTKETKIQPIQRNKGKYYKDIGTGVIYLCFDSSATEIGINQGEHRYAFEENPVMSGDEWFKSFVNMRLRVYANDGWYINNKKVVLSDYGLSSPYQPGGYVALNIFQAIEFQRVKWVNPLPNLMPEVFIKTDGERRFYNAHNYWDAENETLLVGNADTMIGEVQVDDKVRNPIYKENETDADDKHYEFENEYIQQLPHEHIEDFEDIKPTIEGQQNHVAVTISEDTIGDWANQYQNYFTKNVDGTFSNATSTYDASETYYILIRIDVVEAFAYDETDNDEIWESSDEGSIEGEYKHPYFFAKLRPMGFNIFDLALQEDMVLSMTTGNCGACNFKIGVDENSKKNPVQLWEYDVYKGDALASAEKIFDAGTLRRYVDLTGLYYDTDGTQAGYKPIKDELGVLEGDTPFNFASNVPLFWRYNYTYDSVTNGMVGTMKQNGKVHFEGDVVTNGRFIDSQQDTTENYVWVALMKDTESYGVIMPSARPNYNDPTLNQYIEPKGIEYTNRATGEQSTLTEDQADKFVLTNIRLPQIYLRRAERELSRNLVKYMYDHNWQRFNFSINFSRIFLAENASVDDVLNENSVLYVFFNGNTYRQYVKHYTYRMTHDVALPEISVDMNEGLSVSRTLTQQWDAKSRKDGSKMLARFGAITRSATSRIDKTAMKKDGTSILSGNIVIQGEGTSLIEIARRAYGTGDSGGTGGSDGTYVKISRMLQANYDAIPTKDGDTIYVCTDTGHCYLGDTLLSPTDTSANVVFLNGRTGNYQLFQYALCACDDSVSGAVWNMVPLATSGGTGSKTANYNAKFPIGCSIYYHPETDAYAANTDFSGKAFYTTYDEVDARYTAINPTGLNLHNSSTSDVFLHVNVDDGYWSPYYKEGVANEIIVTSNSLANGNFYIYLGKTSGSTTYKFQLESNHPLYYYDGTQLVDYATWIASQNAPQFTYEYKKFDMQYQEITSGGLIVYDWASSTLASLSNGTYKVTVQRHAYSSVTWPSVLHMTLRYGVDNSWVGISASTSIIPAAIQTQDAYDPLGAITVVMVGFLTLGDQRNNLQLVQEGVSGLCFGGELPYGGSCIESVVVNDFVLLEKIG